MNSGTRKALLVSIAVSAVFLAACSSGPKSSSVFSRGNSGQVQSVQMGTIQALRPVTITNDSRGRAIAVGATAGAVVAGPGSVDDYRVGDRIRVTNDGTTTRVAR